MERQFEFLTVQFFTKASVYPGKPDSTIQVWVYENVSFELAQDVETKTFPWTEEGVEQIKDWLNEKLAQRGTEPYRIPYPAPKAQTES